jgi:ribonuclease HII
MDLIDLQNLSISAIRDQVQKVPPTDELIRLMLQDRRHGVRQLAQTLLRRREKENEWRQRIENMRKYEEEAYARGFRLVAGIDEAGRGPLAGPVVAAAVILPPDARIQGIDDSKKLRPEERESLFQTICGTAVAYGIGIVDVSYIDTYNILQATYEAMRCAIRNLEVQPDLLLNDAVTIPSVETKQVAITKGDACCQSIAAASILAKVTRDRIMVEYAKQYPEYGFDQHKGYGTPEHLRALQKFGPTPLHRRTFAPVKEILPKE